MNEKSDFQQPMQPWADLARFAGIVRLPQNGLNIFCYDSGNPHKPVLLLVHGLGDDADTWRHILPSLAETHRVLAPDLPGFGRSDKPQRKYSIPFYDRVLLELLDVLQVGQVNMIGHSMGAMIAQFSALNQPERVKRLLLLAGGLAASATRLDWRTLLFLVPYLGEWQYNGLRRDPQSAFQSLQPYYRSLKSLPQPDQDFLFLRVNQRVWSDGQRDAFLSTLRSLAGWLPGQQKLLPGQLAGFNKPTLILWGEADQVNPVGNARALALLQPQARLVILPQAGHNLHQEDPRPVLGEIEKEIALGSS